MMVMGMMVGGTKKRLWQNQQIGHVMFVYLFYGQEGIQVEVSQNMMFWDCQVLPSEL